METGSRIVEDNFGRDWGSQRTVMKQEDEEEEEDEQQHADYEV
jgi:hypothetical protein